MFPDTPFRLSELERRMQALEQKIEAMKFDAVIVRVNDCRDDIAALDSRAKDDLRQFRKHVDADMAALGKKFDRLTSAAITFTIGFLLAVVSFAVFILEGLTR